MTLHIDRRFSYPASPSTVVDMMADPEFQKRKAAASGALSHEVTVQPGPAPVVTVVRRMPVDHVPEMLRALVKRGITIRETVRWRREAPDGSREGTVTLEILGQPVTMRGTIRLTPAADRADASAGTSTSGGTSSSGGTDSSGRVDSSGGADTSGRADSSGGAKGTGRTDGHIEAEVKAAIPLLGGKVEKAVEPAILAGIKTEVETGQAYLAEHS